MTGCESLVALTSGEYACEVVNCQPAVSLIGFCITIMLAKITDK